MVCRSQKAEDYHAAPQHWPHAIAETEEEKEKEGGGGEKEEAK